jgi:hypothetical protein
LVSNVLVSKVVTAVNRFVGSRIPRLFHEIPVMSVSN